MGKVVKLEKPAQSRSGRRTRRTRSKTALVLGGGGFTGGVYEIGALRALDLLAVNRTVNEFDVYVGTSAGSFVASLAANGVTPEEMMRVVNQQVPTPFRDINMGTVLQPSYAEVAKSLALMPLRSVGLIRSLLTNIRQTSLMDILLGLAEGLPPRRPPRCRWSTGRSRSRDASSSTAGCARRPTWTSRSSTAQSSCSWSTR